MTEVTTKDDFLCTIVMLTFHLIEMGGWFISVGIFITIYQSSYSWILFPYLYWAFVIDVDRPDREVKPFKCFVESRFAKYLREYYPVRLIKSEEYELDPKKNYFFIAAPHGVLGEHLYLTFGEIFGTIKDVYPQHKISASTISAFYKIPFYREIVMSLGGGSCSKEALTYILTRPGGGYGTSLMPGGAEESFHSWPHTYKTIIHKRKGFIKISLKTGAPLVPVVCFNINEQFDYQIRHPLFRKFQNFFKKFTYISPVIGRGRYYHPFLPKRVAVTFVGSKYIFFEMTPIIY